MPLCPSNDGDLDVADTLYEQDVKSSIVSDLCHRDVKFATPRRLLPDARLPIVDHKMQFSAIKSLESDQVDVIAQDPLTLQRVPALSVITDPWMLSSRLKERNKETARI